MSEILVSFENRNVVRTIRLEDDFDKVVAVIRHSSREELSLICPTTEASLLFYAVQRPSDAKALELCRILCEELNVCDPKQVDQNQQTALFFAARDGHVECVRYLISRGCPADHRDSVEQTALFYAARDGRNTVVELLLNSGVDINNVDRLGQTALFYGARDGRTETIALMLKHGAHIHICDRHRRTATYYAMRNNHHEIIALLTSAAEAQKALTSRPDGTMPRDSPPPMGAPVSNASLRISPQGEENESDKPCESVGSQKRQRTGAAEDLHVTRDATPENLQPVRRRCYRLCMRGPDAVGEELRWLSAPLEQVKVFESLLPSIAVWPRDAPCPVSDILMNTRAFWQPIALSIIDELAQSKEGWIFLKPVDCKAWKCPDYYDVIKYPMDFMTMRKKFRSQLYIRCQDFVNDLELIFSNCFRYNRPESNVAFLGRSIQAHYQSLASKKGISRWVALETELEQWYYTINGSKEVVSNEIPVETYALNTSLAANAG